MSFISLTRNHGWEWGTQGSFAAMATLCLPLPPMAHPQALSLRRQARQGSSGRQLRLRRTTGRAQASYRGLDVLYDDGYGTVKDLGHYYKAIGELAKHDGGPPRWLCPVDAGGPTVDGAPVMLYLPGIDGMGMGLCMHHKALGTIFELRCMHIPLQDRTPFEELVIMVEDAVRAEHSTSPNKPIYLLGNSFGGCVALAVAARNPSIDLILVLANPATSFERSRIKTLLSVFSPLPDRVSIAIAALLNYNIDNEVNMARSRMRSGKHPLEVLSRFTSNMASSVKHSRMLDKLPKDTLRWKIKLIKEAASYANSHIQSVTSEVLLLASCADRLLPSKSEANRLQKKLPKCRVFLFEKHGHSLLLEYGVHVSSIIKCSSLYRHSRRYHRIHDYIPPSATDMKEADKISRDMMFKTCPVMYSTMEDGAVVRGLAGLPEEGPVLLVGNHMLMGTEIIPLGAELMRRRKVVVRGVAHPLLFLMKARTRSQGHDLFDFLNLWGGVPMTYRCMYELLAAGEFVLLYPGGYREALHCKGEEHRLFWPDQAEFVRMAAQFGATIVPFGVVGEDDLVNLLWTFDDIRSVPFGGKLLRGYSSHLKLRDTQEVIFPGAIPKIPGRFYYRFGKPIPMRGRQDVLTDRRAATELYFDVKSEVEGIIAYLLEKREEDRYRSILPRLLYRAVRGSKTEVPAFNP